MFSENVLALYRAYFLHFGHIFSTDFFLQPERQSNNRSITIKTLCTCSFISFATCKTTSNQLISSVLTNCSSKDSEVEVLDTNCIDQRYSWTFKALSYGSSSSNDIKAWYVHSVSSCFTFIGAYTCQSSPLCSSSSSFILLPISLKHMGLFFCAVIYSEFPSIKVFLGHCHYSPYAPIRSLG